MKVLLINSNLLKPPITPLGLAYLSSAVKNAGHDVTILDLNFSEDIRNDISKTISDFSPDVIGISIRNIDNVTMLHSVYFIPTIKEIITLCKEFTDVPIVLGGPGFSMMPVEILKELDVPYGIVGEGEVSFPNMLSCLNRCDRRCIYCTYPIIEGRKLRFRYPKNVVDELEILINEMGIDYLHFSDSTFNIPNEHAIFICREMIRMDALYEPLFAFRGIIRAG